MKKLLFILLALTMCISVCACGGSKDAEEIAAGIAEIKDCRIEISKVVFSEDRAIAYINFTNNSDKSVSLSYYANVKAFQNGVELNDSIYIAEDENIKYDIDDTITSGNTIKVALCYNNIDSSAPIVIQICDNSSNTISEKTFNP